jgi:ABC-2 type transport system permease protein
MKALIAQSRAEVTMTIRRGETLLLTIGIPVVLLVFFTKVSVTTVPTSSTRVDFLAPGIIALCVMSTSMVALSIATAFERTYGVLRRLHVTPLGRGRLIGAKVIGVLVVETIQIVVIAVVAGLLGWAPNGGIGTTLEALALLALATIGFAGIGLALAGRLRAEVDLAAVNGLYVVLLLISGFVIPLTSFPSWLQHVIIATPSGALAQGLRLTLAAGTGATTADFVSLVLWAIAAPFIAARTFRFE